MPKAQAMQFINAARTIKVPLVFEDEEGARQTEEFSVKYRSFSPKVAAEMAEAEKDETNRSLARSLAKILVSIPDILDGATPIAMTAQNLEQMSSDNLLAIYGGVLRDINPTAAARLEASPATSPAAASTG